MTAAACNLQRIRGCYVTIYILVIMVIHLKKKMINCTPRNQSNRSNFPAVMITLKTRRDLKIITLLLMLLLSPTNNRSFQSTLFAT